MKRQLTKEPTSSGLIQRMKNRSQIISTRVRASSKEPLCEREVEATTLACLRSQVAEERMRANVTSTIIMFDSSASKKIELQVNQEPKEQQPLTQAAVNSIQLDRVQVKRNLTYNERTEA